MTVTRLKALLMLLAIGMTALTGLAVAEETTQAPSQNSSSSKPVGGALLNLLEKNCTRKRMPSKNILEIIYADGNLTLESSISSGCYTLTLDNEETGAIVTIPTISVGESVSIDLDCGQYTVTATGSEGQSYEGFMELM